ncbi:hypothetical protein D9M68_998190 [compost metagenome]
MSIPTSSGELSQLDAKRLLKGGLSIGNQWPQKLVVPISMAAGRLLDEAEQQGVKIERIAEADLEAHLGDARRSFREFFRGHKLQ